MMKIYNPFKRKESRAVSVIMNQVIGDTVAPERNYELYAKETYLKNLIAFACIFKIAQAVSSVEWKVYETNEKGEKEEVLNHPLSDLFTRANPKESFSRVMIKATSYLVMAGNSYLEKVAPTTGPNMNIPKEIYALRPDRMVILKSEKGITGYKYTVNNNSVIYDVDSITGQSNILHMLLFHPTDDFYGAAITESAAEEIDTNNEGTKWNRNLLKNQARPGMIFTYEGNLTDDQFDRLEKQLNERHTGTENSGKNLILEGVGQTKTSVSNYGFSPQELDFIEGNRELSRRICTGYGVPPQLIGISGDSTYANFEQARQVFWEDTVIFYLNYFQNEFNNWIFGENENNYKVEYSLEHIPAFETKKQKKLETIDKISFLTYNEKREIAGYDPTDGGDVLYIPATLLPIGSNPIEEADLDKDVDNNRKALKKQGYSDEEIEEMLGVADYK